MELVVLLYAIVVYGWPDGAIVLVAGVVLAGVLIGIVSALAEWHDDVPPSGKREARRAVVSSAELLGAAT
jgi:hypothetical protein